jgi:hypothetical protein
MRVNFIVAVHRSLFVLYNPIAFTLRVSIAISARNCDEQRWRCSDLPCEYRAAQKAGAVLPNGRGPSYRPPELGAQHGHVRTARRVVLPGFNSTD